MFTEAIAAAFSESLPLDRQVLEVLNLAFAKLNWLASA